jgi:ribosomal protein S27AE
MRKKDVKVNRIEPIDRLHWDCPSCGDDQYTDVSVTVLVRKEFCSTCDQEVALIRDHLDEMDRAFSSNLPY